MTVLAATHTATNRAVFDTPVRCTAPVRTKNDAALLEFLRVNVNGQPDRAFFEKLTAQIASMPQAQLVIEHEFLPGLCARKMTAPAGALIVGRKHATANFIALLEGTICVFDEVNGVRLLHAPHVEAAPAGVKRLGYCLTRVVWQNFFATHETDLAKLESTLSTESKEIPCRLL